MSVAAIVNLVGANAIDIGADVEINLDIDDDAIDLNGTPLVEIRKFSVSVQPTTAFVAVVDQAYRRIQLKLPLVESLKLIPGNYSWSVLMVYGNSSLYPGGWREYLIRGRLEAVLQ